MRSERSPTTSILLTTHGLFEVGGLSGGILKDVAINRAKLTQAGGVMDVTRPFLCNIFLARGAYFFSPLNIGKSSRCRAHILGRRAFSDVVSYDITIRRIMGRLHSRRNPNSRTKQMIKDS